jgi:hypothetical protein
MPRNVVIVDFKPQQGNSLVSKDVLTTDKYHGVITQKFLISINVRENQNFEMPYINWVGAASLKICETAQHWTESFWISLLAVAFSKLRQAG